MPNNSTQYSSRASVVKIIFAVVGIIFIIRLASLQIFNREYKDLADKQALQPHPVSGPRVYL